MPCQGLTFSGQSGPRNMIFTFQLSLKIHEFIMMFKTRINWDNMEILSLFQLCCLGSYMNTRAVVTHMLLGTTTASVNNVNFTLYCNTPAWPVQNIIICYSCIIASNKNLKFHNVFGNDTFKCYFSLIYLYKFIVFLIWIWHSL